MPSYPAAHPAGKGPALLAGRSSPKAAAYRGNHGMTPRTQSSKKDPA